MSSNSIPSPLSDDERAFTFPVHIDLGKSPNKSAPSPVNSFKGSTKKPKKFYPTMYLSDIPGLENIPKEGCALIEFKRVSMTKSERDGNDPTHSIELEIHTICLPEEGGAADEGADMESGMKKTAKGMGVDLGESTEPAAEEAAETEEDD